MRSLNIPLGRYDNPEEQMQEDYNVDLYNSNLAIFGSSMSGKTVQIKTLLLHMHQVLNLTEEEEIYILDFGNGLKEYLTLPYVVGYFNASNEESVRRVFKILKEKLTENTKKLSGQIYSEVEEMKRRPSHVTFILDGFSSFITEERYFVYQDMLKKIARDGLSKGITVVITGSDTSGFNRISSSFNRIIAFDLPKDSYSELYSRKTEKPVVLKGRGVANDELNTYEYQAYLPWNFSDHSLDEKKVLKYVRWKTILYDLKYTSSDLRLDTKDEGKVLDHLLSLTPNIGKQNKNIVEKLLSRKVKMLPEEYLTTKNWNEYSNFSLENNNGDFVAGLDYYSLEPIPSVNPVTLNLKDAQTIAIYGKKEFGKSNLLKLLIESAARIPNTRFCFWEDGRHALSKPVGLNHLISQLDNTDNAKTVYNEEDFYSYLEKNGFVDTEIDDEQNGNSIYNPSYISEDRNLYDESLEQGEDEDKIKIRMERDKLIQEGDYEGVLSLIEKNKNVVDNERETYENESVNNWIDDSVMKSVSESVDDTTCEYLTIFVIQSRLFYQSYFDRGRRDLISEIESIIGKNSSQVLFIFSDVQRMENRDFQIRFNNIVRYAFLLDDIVRFINNKGQNSVFGNQDISELKESFGTCELGDGFFYDIDRDCISKMKFIHSFPDTIKEGE